MTYNNPVFIEQCKQKGIKIDETGFVEQIPIDKKEKLLVKEVDEDEDEDDEDDDIDDEDDFEEDIFKRPSKRPLISHQSKQHMPEIKHPDNDEIDDIEGSEIALKIGGSKISASTSKEDIIKTPPTNEKLKITPVAPPSITTEELAELFGHETPNEEPKIEEPKSSVRDRMNEELKDVKPTLKLNISKTSSNTSTKPKIKLNINSKQ